MVLAPKVTAPPSGTHPTPPNVAKTMTDVKADNGWGVVKDPTRARETARRKSRSRPGSNTSSPAKPVNPADLKLVSAKGTQDAAGTHPTHDRQGQEKQEAEQRRARECAGHSSPAPGSSPDTKEQRQKPASGERKPARPAMKPRRRRRARNRRHPGVRKRRDGRRNSVQAFEVERKPEPRKLHGQRR